MTTPESHTEAEVAQGLIAREQADLRAGFRVLTVFFASGALLVLALSVFVIHRFAPIKLPVAVIAGLLLVGLGLRLWRLRRAAGKAQRLWQAGKLSNGEDALAAARSYLARTQKPV